MRLAGLSLCLFKENEYNPRKALVWKGEGKNTETDEQATLQE